MDGTLRYVTVEDISSGVVANAAISATTITIEDTLDFEENGGQVAINGIEYDYTALDLDTGVMKLATPLTVAVTTDDTVYVLAATGTVAQDWTAEIEWGAGEEPDDADIPIALIPYFRAGDEQAGATVSFKDDGRGGYEITSRPGENGIFDGDHIDGATLPDQLPTTVPDEILTLTAVGDALGITAVAQGDAVHGTTFLDWYIDGVFVERTRTPVYRFVNDSAAGMLANDTDYTITVQPWNVVGPGAMSAPVTARLDQATSPQTVLGWVAAGFLLVGQIQVGTAITISSAPGPDGGIKVQLSNGGLIHFPADGSDAVITAILRARSLISENYLRIQGQVNAVEGALVLANGVVAPTVKPRAGNSWDHAAAFTALDLDPEFGTRRGLVDDGAGHWLWAGSLFSGWIASYSKTSGLWTGNVASFSGMQPFGGLVKVGSFYYVLMYKNASSDWWVRKYNTSWVFQSEWNFNRATSTKPAIGTDGTDLWIARATGTGRIEFSKWSVGGILDAASTVQSATGVISATADITGVYVGSAAFAGSARWVASAGTTVYVLNSSGTRQTSQEFTAANGDGLRGFAYDGTRLHSLGYQNVWHYGQLVTDTSRSITHTWNDSAAPTHETQASPAMVYTQRARQWLQIDTDPPAYAGGADDPDSVGIYIADQLQGYLATGVTTVVYDLPTTGGTGAPTSNGFAGVGAPGSMKSAAQTAGVAVTELKGDGSVRMAYKMQSGEGTSGTLVAGTTKSIAVTYPTPLPTGVVPVPTVSLKVNSLANRSCGYNSPTNTGFNAVILDTAGTTALPFGWTAVVP